MVFNKLQNHAEQQRINTRCLQFTRSFVGQDRTKYGVRLDQDGTSRLQDSSNLCNLFKVHLNSLVRIEIYCSI